MKRFLALLITTLTGAAFVAAGCGNGSLLDPSLSESDTVGTLSLSAVHSLQDGSALAADGSGAKVLVNDAGFQITLTHASLGYRSLALVSSGDDPECVGGGDVTLDLNGSDDLLGEDLVGTTLGSHKIPLASFCTYTLTFGPSAEEAAALKFHAGEDHEGEEGEVHGAHATFHLAGTWSKDGGAETEFEIESEEPVAVSGAFGFVNDEGAFEEHPLHFHEGETETSKIFGVAYDALFDGVDFESDTADAVLEKIAANLAESVEVRSGH